VAFADGGARGAANDEEATRQQGDLFLRENSSNGGKAIRTFWLHTKFGQIRCQGEKICALSHYYSISYFGEGERFDSLFVRLWCDRKLSKPLEMSGLDFWLHCGMCNL
jgi:hypothetical protein